MGYIEELYFRIADYLDYEGIYKRNGKYRCINPNHVDEVPSMKVYEDHAYCFGCNSWYNTITAYMTIHNCDRETAIRELCEIFKISQPVSRALIEEARYVLTKTLDILRSVKFDAKAYEYLQSKGVSPKLAKQYGVVPFVEEIIREMCRKHPDASALVGLDKIFTDGILFTVFSVDSSPIAFVARNFSLEPKFRNPANNALYNKSYELYGQHLVAGFKSVMLVEGYSDALVAWTKGKHNVLALGGTQINSNTIARLRSLGVKNVAICLDGDQTGKTCTLTALSKLQDANFSVYVGLLQDGMDPDEYFAKDAKIPIYHPEVAVYKMTQDLELACEYVNLQDASRAVDRLAEVANVSAERVAILIANKIYADSAILRREIEALTEKQQRLRIYKEAFDSVKSKIQTAGIVDFDI